MSVLNYIFKNAENNTDKIAIIEKNEQKNYLMLSTDIKRVASKLVSKGVKKNQIVMLIATNDYGFICTYFAIHLIGAVAVGLAPDTDNDIREEIISLTSPQLFIESCSDFVRNKENYSEYVNSAINNNNTSDILFTSGTTGKPKGVVLTHGQVLNATKHIISQVRNTSSDIELLLMPLCHSFGMARMRTTLHAGGALVLGYSLQRLKDVFKAIELHKVTGLGLVPSAWKFITNLSRKVITKYADQLKYIEFGSAPLSNEDKILLTEWFPQTHIVMHYGLTEVSRALFTHLHTDNHKAVGNISSGAKIKIINENKKFLGERGIGEIVLKAPWMFSEYYENAELTEESYINGYFRTGDQGYIDGKYLFLTGRIKEIINVGGKKFSPYRIESIINKCDYVKESACVGYPEKNMGEVVHAFIVLNVKVNVSLDEVTAEMQRIIASKLPVHMRPHNYHYLASLPKTPTGKIKRMKLLTTYK